jgi:acyl-CoA thioester hydrolase
MTTTGDDRVHRHPLRVYFEDTDAGGMAYHATYLRWAERGRTEALRAIGLPHRQMIDRHNTILVVHRIEVGYARPARLDDALVVETAIVRVTGAQVVLDQAVVRAPPEDGPTAGEGERLATLRVGLVAVDRDLLRPVPIPEPWRSTLRGLVRASGGPGTNGPAGR